MAATLVSILIRSMDRPTLERALASVAAQTHPLLEVVVVAACGARHRPLPDRIGPHALRLVLPPAPLDRPAAANAALDAASGAWLNLLDDDDELLPGHVATLLQVAEAAGPEVGLVHARSLIVDAAGAPRGEFGGPVQPWLRLEAGFFHPQAALFSRALLAAGARFDPAFAILEDMDFWLQCGARTRFAFLDQVTSRYHGYEGDSGAGLGPNSDPAKVAAALAQLRAKWSALAAEIAALPQRRLLDARARLEDGQDAEAAALLEPLLGEAPGDVNVLNLAGVAALRLGRYAQAIARLEAALALAPAATSIRANLALARQRLGAASG